VTVDLRTQGEDKTKLIFGRRALRPLRRVMGHEGGWSESFDNLQSFADHSAKRDSLKEMT
jgi:hypothetical protein